MILAGDMGGTNTRLALVEKDATRGFRIHGAIEKYGNKGYGGIHEVLREFLGKRKAVVRHACVAVAGPVIDGHCQAMNLPWVIDARELVDATRITRVSVINDLEANAYGIDCLAPDDLVTIQKGDPQARGNGAVVSAGTGLGEAGMYWDGQRYRPFATEGGHTDFAPLNRLQFALYEYLLDHYDHVSYERIVSGPGLVNIYRFLRDRGPDRPPVWRPDDLGEDGEPHPAAITRAATDGGSALCLQALDMFLELYGTEAGNMALKVMARGGVWLGGGIVVKPKVLKRLRSTGAFRAAFNAKGRLSRITKKIPVHVILNDDAALLGAARYAVEFA
jgi:glucokinase